MINLADLRLRPTEPFSPDWDTHPSVLIGIAALGLLYAYGLGPWRRRHAPDARIEPLRVASFAAALLVLLISLNGPMHDLSDYYLFSGHMVQHLLLTLLMPPLLIWGTPGWMIRPFVRPAWVRTLGRTLTNPVMAGILFSATIAVWHTVPAYELMMRDHDVHIATHLLFMVVAVIMWWPVMSPLEEVPALPLGVRMLYLFLVGIPMQIVAAIITFADTPLYSWYVVAPRTWGLTALDDQRLGALLMWVPGGMWFWGAMSVVFFRWAKEEGKGEVPVSSPQPSLK
jgi:putative membrane protein